MIEPAHSTAIESLIDTEAPLTICLINEPEASERASKIKSDWWSLRADLRPMSEYGINLKR